MRKTLSVVVAAVLGLGLTACDPGVPQESDKYQLEGSADQLTTDEYNKLTPLEQYQVANKVMSALHRGIPANEFFEPDSITSDPATLKVAVEYKGFLGTLKKDLAQPTPGTQELYTKVVGDLEKGIVGKYDFSAENGLKRRKVEIPLAFLYELPLGDEFFARWMAYKLVNTILFSPAEEIDSADENDVETVYENLAKTIKADTSVRQIILAHEKSEANWRRFRSPEDNTREMIEIYLGLFDRDADVPLASIACQNWSLSDAPKYELQKSANENDTPQKILDGYYVTTCDEFFEVIANHPLVIPRMTTVLIDHMFGVDYDSEKRSAMARDIAASSPQTFKDIFLAILFSEEFLKHMDRAKWFEESFFNVAARTYFKPHADLFAEINNADPNAGNGAIGATLLRMYQPGFRLKLGRWPSVPGDVLATSYHANGVRTAMLNQLGDPFNRDDLGWGAELIKDAADLSTGDFISYMFISVLGRMPSATELAALTEVIDTAEGNGLTTCGSMATPVPALKCPGFLPEKAMLVMDYIARLPELYFYNAVN
jgi:hypothetical protein